MKVQQMTKRQTSRKEPTPDEPMKAWLSRDKNGKLRGYRWNSAGHYYFHKPSGQQRLTNWLTVAVQVIRELALKGICVLCTRSGDVLIDSKYGAEGFYAFFDGKPESDNPYDGETYEVTTELTPADKWVFGWRTAHDYEG